MNFHLHLCLGLLLGLVTAEDVNRGLLRDVPRSLGDALHNLAKRDEATNTVDGFYRNLRETIKYLDVGEWFANYQSKKKRNVWQLPTLIGSKNISQDCITGFLMAIPALADILFGEIPFWPLHLVDSTGKSAVGPLRGTRRKRGNLHECIRIDAKPPILLQDLTNVSFTGKFCHIIAEYGYENYVYHMEHQVIPPKETRRTLDTEICFPSTCTDHDVVSIVETFSNELIYDEFQITYMKCMTTDKGSMSSWTIAAIVLCSIWGFILLTGTAFDVIQDFVHNRKRQNWLDPSMPIGATVTQPLQHGRLGRVLLSFSIPRNFGYLLDNPVEYPPDEVIPVIGGLRFVTFLWMHITTIYLIAIKLPWGNYAGILEDLRTANFQWILNGRFAAETTFCISGFLSSYVTLKTIHRDGGHFSFFRYCLRRYWRLVPSYALVMTLASAFFWYCFDEGPEWVTKHQYEDACKQHWWKALLFINNFFQDTESCPPISWYFAVHMQLHVIAPFIVYILYTKPRIAIWLIALMTVAFASTAALMTASQDLPFFIGRLFYFEENHQEYLDYVLQMPYTHTGPFLIGMLFGYMLFVNGIQPTIRKTGVIGAWITSTVIIIVTIYGFYKYIDGAEKMPFVMGLFYTTLVPSLWAAAIGWIIYACATGYGPFINGVLSLNIFSNFNRLSFCCYLAQALAIKHILLSRPDPLYYEPWMMILIVNGSVVIAIFGGIAISVAIERPCLELEKALSYTSVEEQNSKTVKDFSDDEEDEEIRN